MLFLSLHSAFAQSGDGVKIPLNGLDSNPKLDLSRESGLDYRYQVRDWSMPRYPDSLTFGSKLYLNVGYGVGDDWKSAGSALERSFIFGMGYNFSPVHSIEFDARIGGATQSASVAYYMNLNNAALRRDASSRFDVLMGAGADLYFEDSGVDVDFSASVRGRYNLTRNLGLYVEPKASFGVPTNAEQSVARVTTSLNVGANYRFGVPELYISDYILPRALRNPKRLDVPYEFDVVPFFAFKSNLLFDLATALNIAVEVPIGDKWSVNGEWMFPWWITDDATTAFQLLSANVEGRYWFGDRTKKLKLTGLFAGYYIGGGLYDLRMNSKGYQGEFYIASGFSGGYAHAINKSGSLRMEYALGLGYLNTDYRYYEGRADNRFMVWQYNGRYVWLGPTRASVSMVWMLNINKKRGGKR